MSTILRNFICIVLFSAPCPSLGMEPQSIKIQTSDEEFEVERHVAQASGTIKNMIEDFDGEVETPIPLPQISGQQFNLLLAVMKELAKLPMAESFQSSKKTFEEKLDFFDLILDKTDFNNQQLMEFAAGANYLDIPLVEPAIFELACRVLRKDDFQRLAGLHDKLKDLLRIHPAMEMFSRQHPVSKVIEIRDGNLISWPEVQGRSITLWDKNTFKEFIALQHQNVNGVLERGDGTLVSWGGDTIKVWDQKTFKELVLQHKGVSGVIEGREGSLISWSSLDGIILVWGKKISKIRATVKKGFKKLAIFEHPEVTGVVESSNGNFISWSCKQGTIKVCDKNFEQLNMLEHPWVCAVLESSNGNLISWSWKDGTIRIWDKDFKEPIILEHQAVSGILESSKGNLISWSRNKGTIHVWDHNLQEHVTLQHPRVRGVLERGNGHFISWSMYKDIRMWNKDFEKLIVLKHLWVYGVIEGMDGNLISWSYDYIIKVWDKELLNPTSELIRLILAVYFVSQGKKFRLRSEERAIYREALNALSPMSQSMLEEQAPDFIAHIRA